jgi:hypothetical protein
MSGILRRIVVAATVAAGMAMGTMVVSPAVGSAQCAPGQFWNAASNTCDPVVAPPPPPPYGVVGPVDWCIGAPIPFVPMSWCFPVGPTGQ